MKKWFVNMNFDYDEETKQTIWYFVNYLHGNFLKCLFLYSIKHDIWVPIGLTRQFADEFEFNKANYLEK